MATSHLVLIKSDRYSNGWRAHLFSPQRRRDVSMERSNHYLGYGSGRPVYQQPRRAIKAVDFRREWRGREAMEEMLLLQRAHPKDNRLFLVGLTSLWTFLEFTPMVLKNSYSFQKNVSVLNDMILFHFSPILNTKKRKTKNSQSSSWPVAYSSLSTPLPKPKRQTSNSPTEISGLYPPRL